MRKLYLAIPAAFAIAVSTPAPVPASAEPEDCIKGCDRDFPGETPEQVAIRGWCYILRGCWL